MSDKQLIDRIARGEPEAQLIFYKLHVDMLFVTANRILNNPQVAEDVVHDAILKAFENIENLKNPQAAAGWVRTIARRMAIDQLKKEHLLETDEFMVDIQEVEVPEHADIDISVIRDAMEKLPPGYRAIINLHLLEGMSFDDIAILLEIKSSSVRSQFARGRMKLINILNRYHVRQS
ncbi:MAG: sigma-70 family RNA polymerase sigma factor [Cryomorphaceae bacterium]|nr:sigma-70 family RNA polymerase sigma factor [Cryomorphaceae bacterium]